eukprot:355292-Chlamydomonas_euryale.AAC.11
MADSLSKHTTCAPQRRHRRGECRRASRFEPGALPPRRSERPPAIRCRRRPRARVACNPIVGILISSLKRWVIDTGTGVIVENVEEGGGLCSLPSCHGPSSVIKSNALPGQLQRHASVAPRRRPRPLQASTQHLIPYLSAFNSPRYGRRKSWATAFVLHSILSTPQPRDP